MARRDFRRGAVAIRQARQTVWFQFAPITATLTAVGGTVYFTLNAAALALRPFTIVRSRFQAMIQSDQAGATEHQVGAVGLAVVSDEAATAGVASMPTPITEMASDLWFVHQLAMAAEFQSTTGGTPAGVFEIDSKAMRKVGIGQDIAVIAEFSSAGSGFLLTLGGRMLVKTH